MCIKLTIRQICSSLKVFHFHFLNDLKTYSSDRVQWHCAGPGFLCCQSADPLSCNITRPLSLTGEGNSNELQLWSTGSKELEGSPIGEFQVESGKPPLLVSSPLSHLHSLFCYPEPRAKLQLVSLLPKTHWNL